MTDTVTKEKRSDIMRRVKGFNTKPEMVVRKYLFSKGFRYRLHSKKLPGTPDIVFSKSKTVVFVNGCFWHNHKGCQKARMPKTRTSWWMEKLERNAINDQKNQKILKQLGWRLIIVWQCDLKPKKRESTLSKLVLDLNNRPNIGLGNL